MKYIVPEYYKYFQCKCGKCRHSCCEGWPVRISIKEYYRLLGIQCSEELRAKLDCALKICSEPTEECYAEMSIDWRGICMLHRKDGLCALQTELGEDNLPVVCRLYPRNTKRFNKNSECSCSNSCEEVVELLMHRTEPLRFEEQVLSIDPEFDTNISSEKYECCRESILIIQNRNLPLPDRFAALENYLLGTDIISKKPDNLFLAFQAMKEFDQYFGSSISICDYCTEVQDYFCLEDKENLSALSLSNISEKYITASKHLKSILPDWQILFEQLIVNHMFYNNFPYESDLEKTEDSFLSLAIVYSFLRFNLLGYMSDKTDPVNIIDFLAAMFRLIEHSDFEYIAVNLFKKYPAQECVPELIYL